MSSYTLEAIAASKVANFEKCLDEGHYLSQFSPLNLNSYNRKTILGTISHEIIAAFLLHENFEIDKEYVSRLFFKIKEKNNYDFEEDYLDKREGLEFIYRNLTVLKKIKTFLDKNNFEVRSEHTYKITYPFYGQADIVLRDSRKSIVIDYKTGRIMDSENEISSSIKKQLLAYAFLELSETNDDRDISAYVLNKKGDFLLIDEFDNKTVKSYSKRIDKFVTDMNKNLVIEKSGYFYCNKCENHWSAKVS